MVCIKLIPDMPVQTYLCLDSTKTLQNVIVVAPTRNTIYYPTTTRTWEEDTPAWQEYTSSTGPFLLHDGFNDSPTPFQDRRGGADISCTC